MAITSYSQRSSGRSVTVTVTSSLSGEVYYHWWMDGRYGGWSRQPSYTFRPEPGRSLRVVCQDTLDADFDPISEGPDLPSRRRRIFWTRSKTAAADRHRIEQSVAGGPWEAVAVKAMGRRWGSEFISGQLDDLTDYRFRIIAEDSAGNESETASAERQTVVGYPAAPEFEIAYNQTTNRVTFSLV